MKLFSIWQPLATEDARTALVFGFLRHAPVERGLNRWISDVVGRPTTASPLEPRDFWPRYPSRLEGHQWTEPELVFLADDGGAEKIAVVIEAKPGYGMHRVEQLVREVIDTAYGKPARRIALIAVGADVSDPVDLESWRASVRYGLDAQAMGHVEVEVHYSSWTRLGRRIAACAAVTPELSVYADDVITQLRLNALLGYEGAPMHDDLEELNLTNAVTLFNRAMIAARQFYLTLHDQPGFRSTGLGPVGNSYRMLRNGASTGLSQHEASFQVNTLIVPYRKAVWEPGLGAYVAFYFADEPQIHVGAFDTAVPSELHWEYDYSDGIEDLSSLHLRSIDKAHLPLAAASDRTEWTYDERRWRAGGADADVAWAVEKLTEVVDALLQGGG